MFCPVCESANIQVQHSDYPMDELGTDSVVLKNAIEISCGDCGEKSVEIPNYNAVMRQIREKLCQLNRLLRGSEFVALRVPLGLTGQECANAMGVSNVTVSRWEHDVSPISAPADRLIRTWTLEALGYSSRRILDFLGELPETGIDSIEIDLNGFGGGSFRYETCQRFGNGGNAQAWMFVNVDGDGD